MENDDKCIEMIVYQHLYWYSLNYTYHLKVLLLRHVMNQSHSINLHILINGI